MKILELFCETKSISKAFERAGHEVFTVDIEKEFNPDLCCDIMDLKIKDIPFKPDVIWASPPCTTFSVSSIGHYWEEGRPKNDKSIQGIMIACKTINFIQSMNPEFWFIENPRGMMRKQSFMQPFHRKTLTYCQYGDKRMKPTDIWTSNISWIPRQVCSPGDNCHESQPRGYEEKVKTGAIGKGTQGLKNAIERSRIPDALCDEIVKVCENNLNRKQQTINEVFQ